MSKPELNKPAPKFKLPATSNKIINSKDLIGKNVVLYFYPKDDTPGCTQEGCDFRDNNAEFNELDTVVLGVSRDSLNSHEKFKAKKAYPHELIADENEELCNLFDVIKDKNMYGKKVRGIERSTFLIDKNGKLVKEWRKVKVEGHVEEVLNAVKELE